MTLNSKFEFSWHQSYFSKSFFTINSHVIKTISFTYNPLYFYYISCDIGKHFSYYVVPFIILCASKNSILLTSWLFLICTMFPLLSYFHVHNSILMTSQFFFTLFFKLDSLHVKSIPWTATKAALAVQNWKMI